MIMEKKNKPKFNVPNLGFFKSVKARWRKPRGTHNKKRMKFKFFGASPKIGYRNPPSIRDLHPSGKREVLVNNAKEVEGLKDVVLRIASSVGAQKRKVIEEKATALHLRIVNLVAGSAKKEEKKPEWKAKEHSSEGRKAAKAVAQARKASKKAEAHKAQKPVQHVHKAK
jgi:large subunit ribosomal protein L32e